MASITGKFQQARTMKSVAVLGVGQHERERRNKMMTWTKIIRCKTPHFNRGGKFLSFEEVLSDPYEYQKVDLDNLQRFLEYALYESLVQTERGAILTIAFKVERNNQ